MKCYRKNGSDPVHHPVGVGLDPSMKCYRKNGSDAWEAAGRGPDGELPQ